MIETDSDKEKIKKMINEYYPIIRVTISLSGVCTLL